MEPSPRVLFLCTGNLCRSVMAEALMRHRAGQSGSSLEVASAGFQTEGEAPPPDTVKVMARRGIDVSDHRSRMVTPADLRTADLVVGMTRTHVWDAALLEPTALTRSFVFGEVVRLNESIGRRQSGESIADWIERLNGARSHGIVGSTQREEIPDPYGRRTRAHERAAREIEKLELELADFAFDPVLPKYDVRWREGKLIWEA